MRNSPILIVGAALLGTAASAQPVPTPLPLPPPITTSVVPAPPPRARPGQPVPRGHMGQWITMKDYPETARKLREEGMTGFVLTVGVDGQVNACQVTYSSGSPRLDMAACQLAKLRARFDPAIDSEGAAEVGYYPGVVNWRLDRMRDAPLPGTVTHSFIVETDGRVTDCRIVSVTGNARKQYRVGPETCRQTAFDRYEEPVEGRKRKRVTEVETIVVGVVGVDGTPTP